MNFCQPGQGSFPLQTLNRETTSFYFSQASSSTRSNLSRFIYSWIAFNIIYNAYAQEEKPRIKQDRQKIDLFLECSINSIIWEVFCMLTEVGRASITLPLVDHMGRNVPVDIEGNKNSKELGYKNFINVVYQIRNYYIHGSLNPSEVTEKIMLSFAEDFYQYLCLLAREIPIRVE